MTRRSPVTSNSITSCALRVVPHSGKIGIIQAFDRDGKRVKAVGLARVRRVTTGLRATCCSDPDAAVAEAIAAILA